MKYLIGTKLVLGEYVKYLVGTELVPKKVIPEASRVREVFSLMQKQKLEVSNKY